MTSRPQDIRAQSAGCCWALALVLLGGCGLGSAEASGDGMRAEGGASTAGMNDPARAPGGMIMEDILAPRPDVNVGDAFGPDPDAPGPPVGGGQLDLKDDGVYLVPGGVAARGQVAAGPGGVAWVERDAPGQAPRLIVWPVTDMEPPRELRVPNLQNPGQLALSTDWLVYVDDRYGDPDIFAVDLRTGYEQAVASDVGAQVEPALRGSVVVWRDCRTCVGDAPIAAEIYRLDLDSGAPEQRLTDGPTDKRSPALGLLADGAEATAWIEGERRLRVISAGVSEAWEMDSFVSTVGVTAGRLTWREETGVVNPDSMKPVGVVNPDSMKPVGVVNPDSMIPTDVFGTNALTGKTDAISVHSELSPELRGAVQAAGGRVAWLESSTDLDVPTRVIVADALTTKVTAAVEITGAWSPALSENHLVFVAPRDDNGGMDDIWVLPLDPPQL